MSDSFTAGLLDADLDTPCPGCGYPVWIRLVEVVAKTAVICPACRSRIWLIDDTGSVQSAGPQIERALNEMVKDINKGLKGL